MSNILNSKTVRLGIILPCYNEEAIINYTAETLRELFINLITNGIIDSSSFVVFIDDGSKDKTWENIERISASNKMFRGLKLSANFGHQNALIAGMFSFKNDAECLITIDADLQDDIMVIGEMIEHYKQ